MKFKPQVTLYFFIICALTVAIFYQCNVELQQKSKPIIICTTSIIADIINNIGQDTINTISLMGPGVDPHLYKPVENDVIKIASADIIFYNGLHLEAKMADLFEQLSLTQTTIAVTKDIPQSKLIAVDTYNQIFDPHVWFDINLWMYAVTTICQALVDKSPDNKNFYEANALAYNIQLQYLLIKTQRIMEQIPVEKRVLITGHDAFSYFGKLYDCKVIGLQGISTESSPGAFDMHKIITLICTHNIPAIFIESSIPIKNIMAIQEGVAAQKKQVKVGGELFSDALGPQDSSGSTYIDMILHNVTTIAQALQ